ncbi:hypothetical protein L198_01264 [Cryptococcus wingfieldii CBS 7118]|uniref:Uncharacterized protein n=1 Tax=Cryptococcus wingfieldii CBS 7118 TaxID=1295528 RepID=A0A1E3JZ49_9TREE|nr:hypothetical protein L198_01264 [Cryptococcus wingfieldii CBS 7118]ODO06035.1 hypothetical protein L198_01264 [Cryptococcus wingfieldii CBS 7118]
MPDQHMQDDQDVQINTQPTLTPAGEELDHAQTGHTEAPCPEDLQRGVWHSFGFQPRDPDTQNTLDGQQDAYLPSPLPSAAANQPTLPTTITNTEEIEMCAPPPTFEASPREGERTVLGGPGPSHTSSDRALTQQGHAAEGEEKQTESSVGPDRSSRGRGKRGRGRPRSNDIIRYPRPPRSSPRLAECAQGLQLQLGSAPTLEGGEDSPLATVTRTSPRQQTHLDVPPHHAGEGTNARYHPYSQPSTPFTSSFPSTSTPSRSARSKAPKTPTPNTPSTPSLSHTNSPTTPITPTSLARRRGLNQGYCLEEAKGLKDEVSPMKGSGWPGWGPLGSGGRRRRMGMSMGMGTGVGMGSSPGMRMTSMDFGAAIPRRPPSMTTSELPPLNPAADSPSRGGNVGDVGALVGGQEKAMEGPEDSEMGEEDTAPAPPTFIENPFLSQNTAQSVEYPPSPRSRAIKYGDEEEKEDGEDGGSCTMLSELHLKEDDSKP